MKKLFKLYDIIKFLICVARSNSQKNEEKKKKINNPKISFINRVVNFF